MEKLADLGLTELQLEIKNTCREIGEKKIVPVREKYDAEGIFPTDIAKEFADAGLFGLFIPEEFGGMGGGTMDMVVAVEELSKYCAGIALSLFGTALGTLPILLCGSEEQKKRYLPRIAEGTIAAFALTEANAGSDAAAVRTVAETLGLPLAHWRPAALPDPARPLSFTLDARGKTCPEVLSEAMPTSTPSAR